MPTYEYQCPEGHKFELLQKMSDRPRARCPVCGRPATRQISGGAGLIFKGSGFYITDYGKDGKGPRQDKETEARPAAAASDTGAAAPSAEKSEPSAKAETTEKPAKVEKPVASKSARKKSKS